MTTENIALQAWRKDISYVLHAVQGESDSRTFNFILYDQTGTVIPPAGKTVSFYVQKPDGTIAMLATTTSGSTISVTLTLQACAVEGIMPCWIQLVDDSGDDLRVDSLLLEVQACALDNAVESSSEFTALQEALGDVAKYSSHITDYNNPHQTVAAQVGAVPTERTVNNKSLSADITLSASDVGAIPAAEKGAASGVAALDAEGKLMHAHAVGFKLGVSQGGTGASDPVNARANLGIGKQLWSGSWSSGTIVADGLDDYSVYRIIFSEVGTCAIAAKNGSNIRGMLGNTAGPTIFRQPYFGAATNGSGTWANMIAYEFNPVSGAQTQALTVIRIYGIC